MNIQITINGRPYDEMTDYIILIEAIVALHKKQNKPIGSNAELQKWLDENMVRIP